MLVIFDDLVSEINKNDDPRLTSLIFNRRHLLKKGTISIIMTS